MVQYKTISLSREGAIARLTFNREAALNALSFEMMREMMDVFLSLESDLDCSVLILEGAGRAFSVGFDLQNLAGMMIGGALPSEAELEEAAQLGEDMVQKLRSMELITLASVHGYAIGGGFLLMSACDFRVVESDTVFSIPEVDMGIPLLWAGVPLVQEVLGRERARDLVMTCRKFGVDELPDNGFVYRSVSSSDRAHEVDTLANTLAAKPRRALRLTKQQFLAVQGVHLPDAAETDRQRFSQAVLDPEFMSIAMAYMQGLSQR